ncbi:unnamed protein product [Bursaphelenchus okinawaensis]|uniref:Uncharacterized protein n=1 Tax=Bursaphelenchus okinawaensis TaxID=465554 RepID=A0A811K1U6_9BILA|nr:unnamed protein product [Bursaphelenchus okinawaensis]CAG9090037.1 unnamed protein product [Bursaphelenchus okinawaensis]
MELNEDLRRRLTKPNLLPAKDGYDLCARIYTFVVKPEKITQFTTELCPGRQNINKVMLITGNTSAEELFNNVLEPDKPDVGILDLDNKERHTALTFAFQQKALFSFIYKHYNLRAYFTDSHMLVEDCKSRKVIFVNLDGHTGSLPQDNGHFFCDKAIGTTDTGELWLSKGNCKDMSDGILKDTTCNDINSLYLPMEALRDQGAPLSDFEVGDEYYAMLFRVTASKSYTLLISLLCAFIAVGLLIVAVVVGVTMYRRRKRKKKAHKEATLLSSYLASLSPDSIDNTPEAKAYPAPPPPDTVTDASERSSKAKNRDKNKDKDKDKDKCKGRKKVKDKIKKDKVIDKEKIIEKDKTTDKDESTDKEKTPETGNINQLEAWLNKERQQNDKGKTEGEQSSCVSQNTTYEVGI